MNNKKKNLQKKIGIVNYGMGNLASVSNCLKVLGYSAEIVQHGVLLSKYGRSTGFPVGPIVHPAFAGTLGLDESENYRLFPEEVVPA